MELTAGSSTYARVCTSQRRSRRKTLDFNLLWNPGPTTAPTQAHGAHRLFWNRGVRALGDCHTNRARTVRCPSTRPAFRASARTNALLLANSLKKKHNPSAKSPGPQMSMSQRSIVASTKRRPYVSRPFLPHARSGISKRGDKYLRSLFIHGARAALRTASRRTDRRSHWALEVQRRRGTNVATVALANKNLRTAWALLTREVEYEARAA